jgi:hypothetical protein
VAVEHFCFSGTAYQSSSRGRHACVGDEAALWPARQNPGFDEARRLDWVRARQTGWREDRSKPGGDLGALVGYRHPGEIPPVEDVWVSTYRRLEQLLQRRCLRCSVKPLLAAGFRAPELALR